MSAKLQLRFSRKRPKYNEKSKRSKKSMISRSKVNSCYLSVYISTLHSLREATKKVLVLVVRPYPP